MARESRLSDGLRVKAQAARTVMAKFLANPERWRRRRLAREWSAASGAPGTVAAQAAELASTGFSRCGASETLQETLLADWRRLREKQAAPGLGSSGKSTGKAFFTELLSDEDLATLPAFLGTALDERVLRTVMSAMGMVPHLESVDILASQPSAHELSASQLWHYDVNDARIIKLFVYLEDCGTANGPFTYIDAPRSEQISGALGHYVEDARIARHVPSSDWHSVEGPAGTAFFIDTGRCYHMGSRSQAMRYAYIATFSSGLKFMKRSSLWKNLLSARPAPLTTLQAAVCGTGG